MIGAVHAVLAVVAGAAGCGIVVATVLSAIQTLTVPRATPLWITRWVFLLVGFVLLVLFRSPQPDRSWVTAAGAVLDAAALVSSTLDLGRRPAAELCLRSGYLALRRIADFCEMAYDTDPRPDDPIAVRRDEFDAARAGLAAAGVAVRADAEQAWRDFAGWRVNYDAVLRTFAGLAHAPTASGSGDPPLPFHRPALPRRRAR